MPVDEPPNPTFFDELQRLDEILAEANAQPWRPPSPAVLDELFGERDDATNTRPCA